MERLRSGSLDIFSELLSRGYDLKVKCREKLDVLRENPAAPAVIYFNHTATDDPLLIYQLMRMSARERMDNAIVPVSESHSKFKKFPAYAAFVAVGAGLWGFDMPRVVQSYRLRTEEPKDEALAQKSSKLGRQLLKLVDQRLAGGPVIMLSPEGHRSETGQLLPAESGAGAVAHLMEKKRKKGEIENGFFIPVAITFANHSGKRFHYNPATPPRVECLIGDTITAGEAIESSSIVLGDKSDSKVISHYLMSQVALLLPENMQGVYHPTLIRDTFYGRFEQWSDKNEKVYIYDKWNQKRFTPAV